MCFKLKINDFVYYFVTNSVGLDPAENVPDCIRLPIRNVSFGKNVRLVKMVSGPILPKIHWIV